MRLTGILRSWSEDRGFGFIAPTHGGAELFVHISSFPRDGSRPVEGESLSYELGEGKNGKPQAVRVVRQAVGSRPPEGHRPKRTSSSTSRLRVVLIAILVLAGVTYAYNRYSKSPQRMSGVPIPSVAESQGPSLSAFRCDGRAYCSQMTSCAEATYFLKHCPGVKMDGNNDGIPCEQQWCK